MQGRVNKGYLQKVATSDGITVLQLSVPIGYIISIQDAH